MSTFITYYRRAISTHTKKGLIEKKGLLEKKGLIEKKIAIWKKFSKINLSLPKLIMTSQSYRRTLIDRPGEYPLFLTHNF